jgi:hypothetical protein
MRRMPLNENAAAPPADADGAAEKIWSINERSG